MKADGRQCMRLGKACDYSGRSIQTSEEVQALLARVKELEQRLELSEVETADPGVPWTM